MPPIARLAVLATAALIVAGPAWAQFEHPVTPTITPPVMPPPILTRPPVMTPPTITPLTTPSLTPTPSVSTGPVTDGEPPDGGGNSAPPVVIANATSDGSSAAAADGSANATNAADTPPSGSHGVPLWIVGLIVVAAAVAVFAALNRSRRR
jgi:hypothetical protein